LNIAIVRFLAFGDVLLTLPLAEALRRNPAIEHIDLITSAKFSAVPEASRFFDNIYCVGSGDDDAERSRLAGRSYDLLIDLHARSVPLPTECEQMLRAVNASRRVCFADQWGSQQSGQLPTRGWREHAVEYYARAAPELIAGPLPEGRVRLPAQAWQWAADQKVDRAVCVVPGARYGFKRWPAARYAALIGLLRAQGIEAVAVGHQFDAEVITKVAAQADCRIIMDSDELRLGALMKRAGIAVTNNSGLMHLAQVSGARCVCIHSHTSPDMWRPWGRGHVNITGENLTCDCQDIGDFESPFPCGKDIDPEAVAAAVAQLVAEDCS
jgi:ADP-heptose:LPS heptosyltransferase